MFGIKNIYQAIAEACVKLFLDLALNLNKNSKSPCTITKFLGLDLSGKVQSFYGILGIFKNLFFYRYWIKKKQAHILEQPKNLTKREVVSGKISKNRKSHSKVFYASSTLH